jgi:Uma2 family endonuclease
MGARRRRIHVFVARPMLAVEIVSPSGRERDLDDKRRECEAAGIPHYWVLDQDARAMHEFALDATSGTYQHQLHTGRRVRSRLFAGDRPALTLDLAHLWPDRSAAQGV